MSHTTISFETWWNLLFLLMLFESCLQGPLISLCQHRFSDLPVRAKLKSSEAIHSAHISSRHMAIAPLCWERIGLRGRWAHATAACPESLQRGLAYWRNPEFSRIGSCAAENSEGKRLLWVQEDTLIVLQQGHLWKSLPDLTLQIGIWVSTWLMPRLCRALKRDDLLQRTVPS